MCYEGLNDAKTNKAVYRRVALELKDHAEKFVYDTRIGMMLTGVGYMMIGGNCVGKK